MRKIFCIISTGLLVSFCGCSSGNRNPGTTDPALPGDSTAQLQAANYKDFKLYYSSAGLGSGMGSMQPVVRIKGLNYVYTYEQNSFYGKPDKKPEPVCRGSIRPSAVDSILRLVKDIKDTLIYRTNIHILSGGIDNLSIDFDSIHLTYQLHNASEPTAKKIIDILNTNIPDTVRKLSLFELPEGN